MRKCLILFLSLSLCIFAEKFVVQASTKSTVEVTAHQDNLRVVCRFPPFRKFEPAVNSKLNDHLGDRFFYDGLIRYFKAGTNGTMMVSGRRILKQQTEGGFLVYTFEVPKRGCKVIPKPKGQAHGLSKQPLTNIVDLATMDGMTNLVNFTNGVDTTDLIGLMDALGTTNDVDLTDIAAFTNEVDLASELCTTNSVGLPSLDEMFDDLNKSMTNTTLKIDNKELK